MALSKNQQDHMRIVWDIIQKLSIDSKNKRVDRTDIIKEAKTHEIKPEEVDTVLHHLSMIRKIYKIPGKYGKTHYTIIEQA